MRVIFEDTVDAAATAAIAAKVAAVRELLVAELSAAEQVPALALVEILQSAIPPSLLQHRSPRDLADHLLGIFRFLSRTDTSRARLLPLSGGRALLLTNTVDAPYLVHSVQMVLVRQQVPFQVVCHPLFTAQRAPGALPELAPAVDAGQRESLIVLLLQGLEARAAEPILSAIEAVLDQVLTVAAARPLLEHRLADLEAGAEGAGQAFLHWLQQGNFLAFAYRRLEQGETREQEGLPVELGATEMRRLLAREEHLVVESTQLESPILRPENLVYLGIREGTGARRVEHGFLGLFSEQSRNQAASSVPALRQRIEAALSRLGIPRDCHDWRKSVEILNTFPKVELFFMGDKDLDGTLRSFSQVYRHGNIKVVVTRSMALQGLTLLLIMPRSFYGSDNLARIEKYLTRRLQAATLTSRVIHISSDYLSLHVLARTEAEQLHIDLGRLERGLTRLVRPWGQRLGQLLTRAYGEAGARQRQARFGQAFGREYRTLVHPRFALRDLRMIEQLLEDRADRVDLWGPFAEEGGKYFRLQFYSLSEKYLNDLMPILENLGLCVIDEVDFTLELAPEPVYIKSFAVRGTPGENPNLAALREHLLEAFMALHGGAAENDYLNRLLIPTGLDWRQIDVFRGYRNYYFQLGSPFTKKRVAFALINNPRVARLLYDYFAARFHPDPHWEDPARREEEGMSPLRLQLAEALEAVADTNEDRILRTLFNLIDSTVRTNFFLRRERSDYFFAFKISALGIIEMPAPRPLFEIYVHAATMEGIHLRGGKVARGGIRWSDRPDDFRTEILGLMKTQMSKNALIVPVGSKGGFVVKTPFGSREEGARLSREAYQVLMRGLLDLTDNRVGEEIVCPDQVVAYDEPDPYLVVAADKGTAQFSDTANGISREYGFWLDDAFASGGSHGYDHKALGITARGAWESVKRHFRELGTDIQQEPFTVVGIGDMSGDVFGNGMLLSPQIRLLAAFDHRHVFLDPDPDPAASFAERQRLFELPRSSWADYDSALISAGGGIYPRDAKEIPLSAPMQRWLGVRHESIDVAGLIRLLLTAEVDLLWNGGIGTYVKASSEKHEDAGDRANDALRVDANQLRAKVVGEGGNLGFTQRGRIEYALGGGRINTDAVDNSGGVDCSDHEVNLKIFMQGLLESRQLTSIEDRNRLLEEVTDDVVAAVLANNDQQSLCLSLDQHRCGADSEPFFALAERLARAGLLDRRGEFLPTAKEVLARPDGVLTRPELAILMAYSKMQVYQALLESDLPGRAALQDRLAGYFPAAVVDRYGDDLVRHPLAREITATVLTNDIIGSGGAALLNRLVTQTGAGLARAAEAYLLFEDALGAGTLRRAIETGNALASDEQYRLLLQLEEVLGGMCAWALERGMAVTVDQANVERYRDRVGQYFKGLGGLLPGALWQACRERGEGLAEAGLDPEIAQQLASLDHFENFLPLVELQETTGGDFFSVAQTFGEVHQLLGLAPLLEALDQVPLRDRWDRLARQALGSAFQRGGFRLACAIFSETNGNPDTFVGQRRVTFRAYRDLRDSLRGEVPANFHPFTVLLHALDGLVEEPHAKK